MDRMIIMFPAKAGEWDVVNDFMDEYTVKYVTGELSFDTYDTDFVEKLRSMDAERMVELYQDAYDEYLAG